MVNYKPPLIGIIGKTNVGKSTLFSAMTMSVVEVSNRPFTTIEPNRGVGYIRIKCPHIDFGLEKCDPRTGYCVNGERFVPVELMDVAGLIPGSHEGKGLGNKFMDELRRADAFILVVDASGSTNEEGIPIEPGEKDPVKEAEFILEEVDLWLTQVIGGDWEHFTRAVETSHTDFQEALYEKVSGLSVTRKHVNLALQKTGLSSKKPSHWRREDILVFAKTLRQIAKPMVIAANKVDLPSGKEGYEKLRKKFPDIPVIPVSAVSELALIKAAKSGVVKYLPGDSDFRIVERSSLSDAQIRGLEYIKERVFSQFNGTGVQKLLNKIVYDALGMVVVFPIDDVNKLTDKKGNILPDALIVSREATLREVAGLIHSELEKGFLYAIDARTKKRLGEDQKVYDKLVFKIVSTV